MPRLAGWPAAHAGHCVGPARRFNWTHSSFPPVWWRWPKSATRPSCWPQNSASRFPSFSASFVATLLNHGLAGALGTWITSLFSPEALHWALGLSFLAMAGWILIPDELDADDDKLAQFGVFGTTLTAFFLAEMGDKTQIATIALAAQYGSVVWVVVGTTLGTMIANVPAVYLGERIAHRMPVRLVHWVAAAIFAILGVAVLSGIGEGLGF
jgi:putative Ca2+/H+ antiporter (TMEM165/GDT1 family)